MLDQLGGRKFVGFILICVMFLVLVVTKLLPVSEFVAFVTANFGIYVAGNVGDAIVGK